MFQPKHFYRELELLLHERRGGPLNPEWFPWLVDEIVSRFGVELMIDSGRVYEEDHRGFRLVHGIGSRDPNSVGLTLPAEYGPLGKVLEHRVFIFDQTVEGQSPELEGRLGGPESAAFSVDSVPRRVLAFGLRPGWQRDDLDFALQTIRNALNLQLTVEGLQMDIAQAAEIQQALLPESPPPFRGFDIAARSRPAEQVGGDFYDFISSEADTLVVAVGDASGHGLGAALLARDTVTGIRMGAERALRIVEIIRRLNRVISRSALSSRFVSLFYADLETTGDLVYVNAGHPAPWLIGDRGVRRLEVGGTILGPVRDQYFRRSWARMDPGDSLVIVTDGLLERENAREEMFGDPGVEAILVRLRDRPAAEILDALFTEAARFGGGRPWEDDTTAVVITRRREPGGE